MAQFDVFANPIPRMRHAYPFVVTLQSDVAQTARHQLVAPLALSRSIPATPRRLTPPVQIDGIEYLVLVPAMTGMYSKDLVQRHGSIAVSRAELLAAIDYLFFGV
jgi:toxin CcdB